MIIWLFINILLPLIPFVIKFVVINMGRPENANINLFEIPELLYLSVYYSIITININNDYDYKSIISQKNLSETCFRFFLMLIIISNCIFLGMFYSNNLGNIIWTYLKWIIVINIICAILYKIKKI